MGIPAEEFERRRRTLRMVSGIDHVCRQCGEVVAPERTFARRDNGELWVDPFQAPGVAMFLEKHPLFCKARPPWWRRPFTRFKGYEQRVVSSADLDSSTVESATGASRV